MENYQTHWCSCHNIKMKNEMKHRNSGHTEIESMKIKCVSVLLCHISYYLPTLISSCIPTHTTQQKGRTKTRSSRELGRLNSCSSAFMLLAAANSSGVWGNKINSRDILKEFKEFKEHCHSTISLHVGPLAASSSVKKYWLNTAALSRRSSGRPRTLTMHFICSKQYTITSAVCTYSPLCCGHLCEVASYHLVFTLNREEVCSQIEEGQGAADSPHVYSLSEGEAEGDFWSPEMERQEPNWEIC